MSAAELAALLDLPRVVVAPRVTSTLDVAHELAADGAPAGTLVLADEQTAGRGRAGRSWVSAAGAGIWLTLVERPPDASAVELLSLRVGLRIAPVLERHAERPISLKWPNDLYAGDDKLAGVLVEARWKDERPDWVAIGVGVNARMPTAVPSAAALGPDTDRVLVLAELVPAIRAGAAARGALSARERARYAERDMALGRRCTAPARGVVRGIDERGALLVEAFGSVMACRAGSLVLEPPSPPR